MIKNLTFFESTEELEEITGLSHDELWENGFNLDDMDWGFCSDEKYVETSKDEWGGNVASVRCDNTSFIYQILQWMDNYCIGFRYTEYNGKHYYILHHA